MNCFEIFFCFVLLKGLNCFEIYHSFFFWNNIRRVQKWETQWLLIFVWCNPIFSFFLELYMGILAPQKWSILIACCHISVSCLLWCRNDNSPVAETRTLVALPYWTFAFKLITAGPQALVLYSHLNDPWGCNVSMSNSRMM